MLATLSLYRKTLSAPLSGVDGSSGRDGRDPNDRGSGEGAEADRSASRGSVWSRWWNRSKSSYDLQAQAHAQDKAERDGERQGGDTGVGRKESDDALAAAAAAGAGMPPRELGRSATVSRVEPTLAVWTRDTRHARRRTCI